MFIYEHPGVLSFQLLLCEISTTISLSDKESEESEGRGEEEGFVEGRKRGLLEYLL